MPRRRHRPTTLLAATLEAQAATWAVLGHRVPTLLDGTASAAERTRMVQEKAEAAAESAQAVGRKALRMMASPSLFATPGAMMAGWLALTEAASRPYHKRVTANAKRLGRTKSRGSG